jgi:sodium-dependent phosphate cotransporter
LFIFENQYRSFGWGLLLTSAIQSSSITTSLVVPLAAADKIKLNWAFPFIIGANVGTTVTALLASVFKPDAAISIAIAHSLFNIFGALLFLPLNSLRKVPVYIADHFSSLASEKRILFFIYVLLTFFLIPFGLIYLGK